jgi:hypothetical protein
LETSDLSAAADWINLEYGLYVMASSGGPAADARNWQAQEKLKMTEQQRMEIEVGMRVMVKVASREIPATVVEVGENWFLVRSDSTGREFKTNRVVDILDAPAKGENEEIAQAAAEIAELGITMEEWAGR